MTAIHYQSNKKPHTPATVHVEDRLLDKTIKDLECQGMWIQQFRKLKHWPRPDPKRWKVKVFRGEVLKTRLTKEQADCLAIKKAEKTGLRIIVTSRKK